MHRQQLRFGIGIETLLQFWAAQVSVYRGTVDEPCPVALLIVQAVGDPYPARCAFSGSYFDMIGPDQSCQFPETPHLVFLVDAVQRVLQIILRSFFRIQSELLLGQSVQRKLPFLLGAW